MKSFCWLGFEVFKCLRVIQKSIDCFRDVCLNSLPSLRNFYLKIQEQICFTVFSLGFGCRSSETDKRDQNKFSLTMNDLHCFSFTKICFQQAFDISPLFSYCFFYLKCTSLSNFLPCWPYANFFQVIFNTFHKSII